MMTATKTTRVFIVEDHNNLRSLLMTALRMLDDMEPCGSAATGEEAVEMIRSSEESPDLVLIDLSLPKMSGLELIQELHRKQPGLCCVILSGHADKELADAALDAGAKGYIVKGEPGHMIEGLRAALAGEVFLSPEVSA